MADPAGSAVTDPVSDTGVTEVKPETTVASVNLPYDDDELVQPKLKRSKLQQSRQCPYLDTINRHVLDFDFEKLCSVSLAPLNAYACMVCGKYYQGRGQYTHAYTHSVDTDHRVFLNLQTLKFYCLPDNYEIIDSSLDDIRYVLQPVYSKADIRHLDEENKMCRALAGNTLFYPGVVGLNNIKANDYINVVLHALSHVLPLRNYFLEEQNYSSIKRPPGDKLVRLTQRFGELMRKLWNHRPFKAHVSPHEMCQAIVLCSGKRFQITQQGDAIDVLSFLLNNLHVALNGTKATTSSIVYRTFRGHMRVYSRKIPPVNATAEEKLEMLQRDEYSEHSQLQPFLYLTLDLPPMPLHQDELHKNIVPQVNLEALLSKYDGVATKEYTTQYDNIMKRFELLSLPRYLILFVKRFNKNNWFIEKNTTIVNFPIKNVDFYECLAPDVRDTVDYTTYDLISNIVHDGQPEAGKGNYRIQLIHKGTGKWFELEDLHVKDVLAQTITLTETYIQVWELNKERAKTCGTLGQSALHSMLD